MKRLLTITLAIVAIAVSFPQFATAAGDYKVCWSRYVGWEPWGYIQEKGIMARWAKKYGINVKLVYVDKYDKSLAQFAAKAFDGCAMTNMDALNVPAAGGVDSQAIIMGDTSAGNDGVVLMNANTMKDIRGRTVFLVEGSVSHYALARALAMNGLTLKDVQLKHVDDSQIGPVFLADKSPRAAIVTWNPMLLEVKLRKGATSVFNSAQIPGEIMDLMVVHTSAPDALKKALVGAWYEAMGIMSKPDRAGGEMVAFMAKASEGTPEMYKAQLRTTQMFYRPEQGIAFTIDPKIKSIMELVRKFSFEAGLMGDGVKSINQIGIQFADGSVLGDQKNTKLRFDTSYMKLVAEGKL